MSNEETPTVVVGRSVIVNFNAQSGCALLAEVIVKDENGRDLGSLGVTTSNFIHRFHRMPHRAQYTVWAMSQDGKKVRGGCFLMEGHFPDSPERRDSWELRRPSVPYARAKVGKTIKLYLQGWFKVEFEITELVPGRDGFPDKITIEAFPIKLQPPNRTRRRGDNKHRPRTQER